MGRRWPCICSRGWITSPSYQPVLNSHERIWRRTRYERTSDHWLPDLKHTWIAIRDATSLIPRENPAVKYRLLVRSVELRGKRTRP